MKRVAAFVLFAVLGSVVPLPARAQEDGNAARAAMQKHNAKQSQRDVKAMKKERKRLLKAQKKAAKPQAQHTGGFPPVPSIAEHLF